MESGLRRAWAEIVTADDYEMHMASVGQAKAAAELTQRIVELAAIPALGRITIAGAGTGQMFDLMDASIFSPYRLTCADLNATFLERLRERLARHGLKAEIVQDDIEITKLEPGADLLLATLLLEHVDWRRGIAALSGL